MKLYVLLHSERGLVVLFPSPCGEMGMKPLAIFKPYPAKLSKGSIDAPHFSLNKQALLTGFQEKGYLGTIARYAIDTPQRNYAVFKVRGGCVNLTIQIRLMAKTKKVNLNNVNIWGCFW